MGLEKHLNIAGLANTSKCLGRTRAWLAGACLAWLPLVGLFLTPEQPGQHVKVTLLLFLSYSAIAFFFPGSLSISFPTVCYVVLFSLYLKMNQGLICIQTKAVPRTHIPTSIYTCFNCLFCFMYVDILPACLSVYHLWLVPAEASRGHWSPWNWSYRQL